MTARQWRSRRRDEGLSSPQNHVVVVAADEGLGDIPPEEVVLSSEVVVDESLVDVVLDDVALMSREVAEVCWEVAC